MNEEEIEENIQKFEDDYQSAIFDINFKIGTDLKKMKHDENTKKFIVNEYKKFLEKIESDKKEKERIEESFKKVKNDWEFSKTLAPYLRQYLSLNDKKRLIEKYEKITGKKVS